MERLGEADDFEGAEGSGEIFGSHPDPVGVGDFFFRGRALGLSQHAEIRVEPDDDLEETCEQLGEGAWAATDVEEAAASIQIEVLGESVGQSRGIRFATLPLIGGGSLEHCLVPGPVLPPVSRAVLGHSLSVADPPQ